MVAGSALTGVGSVDDPARGGCRFRDAPVHAHDARILRGASRRARSHRCLLVASCGKAWPSRSFSGFRCFDCQDCDRAADGLGCSKLGVASNVHHPRRGRRGLVCSVVVHLERGAVHAAAGSEVRHGCVDSGRRDGCRQGAADEDLLHADIPRCACRGVHHVRSHHGGAHVAAVVLRSGTWILAGSGGNHVRHSQHRGTVLHVPVHVDQ